MKVVATNLGIRKKVDWKGTVIETGIFKSPVAFIILGATDVENDVIIDKTCHGGINKAVYAYSADYYPYWKEKYPELKWDFGMFGENLSIEGLQESEAHVGSSYKIGEAIIEVTEPREPCVKLGMRFNNAKIVKEFWKDTKSGVYFKVIKPGKVIAGDVLTLLEEKKENETIAEVYASMKL